MKYFIFAGETSGDLHGGALMQAINHQSKAHFFGVGGPVMRAAGLHTFLKMEDFQVMGFSDVLKKLPFLVRNFYKVLKEALKYDCIILIDYPGFNLRLAKKLRKKGYKGKIVQYISPAVWAHGKQRIKSMTETLDLLLTIFPFETAYFPETNVHYVGNPLLTHIKEHSYQENWNEKDLMAIFPGSRKGEIKQNFPVQLKTAVLFKEAHPNTKFGISISHEELLPYILSELSKSSLKDYFLVHKKYRYDLMKNCTTALAKPGTVSLELALHQCPSIMVYQVSSFDYFIAKYIKKLDLPFYCIVNILANKEIFPEIIGKAITSDQILKKLELVHSNPEIRNMIQKNCKLVKDQLGTLNASQEAARHILELVS